jgi:hypothetical protein
MSVKHFALATLCSLLCGAVVHAAPIELVVPARVHPGANVGLVARHTVVAPPAAMSELPEPEVFAMMLLGLILIGYRASRHSSEKFK